MAKLTKTEAEAKALAGKVMPLLKRTCSVAAVIGFLPSGRPIVISTVKDQADADTMNGLLGDLQGRFAPPPKEI